MQTNLVVGAGSRRIRLAIALAIAWAALAGAAAAAPPPPPPGGPPGAGEPPPPPPTDPTPRAPSAGPPAPSVEPPAQAEPPARSAKPTAGARLIGSRFRVSNSGLVRLRFACGTAFSADLLAPATSRRRRSARCAESSRAVLTFKLGRRFAQRVRARRHVRAVVRIRAADGTRARRAVVFVARNSGIRAAQASSPYWGPSQAQLQCDSSNAVGHPNALVLKWRRSDSLVLWATHKVWFQEYWDDPHGFAKGWQWRSQNGLNTDSPFASLYRVGPHGVPEWSETTYDPITNSNLTVISPWTWSVTYPLGYSVYVRAWVELWLWTGSDWVSQLRIALPDRWRSDAPEYCWNA